MISAFHKFPLRTEFLRFRARASRAVTPHLTLYSTPHTLYSRLSIIVPKKLSKLATTRNWLKRLTYDTLWPLIKARQLDCVVVYKPLSLEKSPTTKQQIISELNSLMF
ncbi:MAG: ribonuclease P protein component [bacterium]